MEAKHRFNCEENKTLFMFLRKLQTFNVHNPLLYTSIVKSTVIFGLACWGGNLLKYDREKLNQIMKTVSLMIGKEQENIDTFHEHKTSKTK